jgi:hypothetical protein
VTVTDSSNNAVTAGWGSDIRAAVVGALMPLGAGLLVLVGYLWLEVFGVFLAVAGGIWWAVWWRRKHGRFVPRDVEGGPFVLTIVLAVVLFIAAIASM